MTTNEKILAIVNDITNVYNGNRTAKMRAIFETLTADGITDPRTMRDTAETSLGYHNKGAIYNVWAKWAGRANYVRTNRAAARPVAAVNAGTDYNAFTFGVEFECGFKAGKYESYTAAINALTTAAQRFGLSIVDRGCADHTDSRTNWKICTDASLCRGNGVEYLVELVSPILSGVDGWTQLEKMCNVMDVVGMTVNSTCGTHVHIGVADETWTTLKNVGINYSLAYNAYCKALHRSRGAGSDCGARWARTYDERELDRLRHTTRAEQMFNTRGLCSDVRRGGHYPSSRYRAVNYVAYYQRKTLEFRQHQGTCDFRKVQSWIKDKMELITWSRNNLLTGYTDDINAMAWHSDDTRANFLMREMRYAS